MKLHPTRGYYDLRGVEGAAGPIQLFGFVAAAACLGVAAFTFGHGPFTAWAYSILILSHALSLRMRASEAPGIGRRVVTGFVTLGVFLAATMVVPGLPTAAITPDMATDPDYFLAGIMVWITLAAQCFASLPGVLLFALVPELASLAVLGQMNISGEVPALYAAYLLAALGLLSYATFTRRPHRTQSLARRVVPAPNEMIYGIAVLFLLLTAGGGVLAVGLRMVIPSPFRASWFQRQLAAHAEQRPQPYEDFGNTLDLRSNTGALAETPVLRARAPRPVLLRRRVYTRYTGDVWAPASQRFLVARLDESGQIATAGLHGVAEDAEPLEVEVVGFTDLDSPLPVAGVPVSVVGLGEVAAWLTPYGTVEFDGAIERGKPYATVSLERTAEEGGLEASGADYPQWVIDEGCLAITPEVLPLRQRALELTDPEPTVAGKVAALQRYVEHECAYNLNAPPPKHDVDSVIDFLSRRKQGTCVDFASALAVLCRLTGIPARVATGYAATEGDPEPGWEGWYIARQKDAHAWVEVYYSGVGWVTHNPNAEREITGGALESLVTRLRVMRAAISVWVREHALWPVLLIPVIYVLLYEARRRGGRVLHRQSPRQRASVALRRILGALEPWASWGMPGRAPWETVTQALSVLPAEYHEEVRTCVAELLALRYGPDTDRDPRLATAITRAREVRRRLRRAPRARPRGLLAG